MKIVPDVDSSGSAVDPHLAAKLEAGERVWLKRHWRNIVSASVVTFVPLIVMAEECDLAHDATGILVHGFFLSVAAWLWVRTLASRLRFNETTVEATDQNWGLSQHCLRLEDIAAAWIAGIGLDLQIRRVTNSHYCVYAFQLTPGPERGGRWVALWITPYAIKANTLLAELRRRCELTEIAPVSQDYHTTVWHRPGFDFGVLLPRRRVG